MHDLRRSHLLRRPKRGSICVQLHGLLLSITFDLRSCMSVFSTTFSEPNSRDQRLRPQYDRVRAVSPQTKSSHSHSAHLPRLASPTCSSSSCGSPLPLSTL